MMVPSWGDTDYPSRTINLLGGKGWVKRMRERSGTVYDQITIVTYQKISQLLVCNEPRGVFSPL
jgi:hypothetical protein